jgi:hypothetical protein
MARKTVMGMPVTEFEELRSHNCTRCGQTAPKIGNHPQRDKSVFCDPCIRDINTDIDRQRAEQNANAERCEGCKRRRGTRYLVCTDRRVLVCGTCQNKTNRVIRQVALFGPPRVTSAQVLESLTH